MAATGGRTVSGMARLALAAAAFLVAAAGAAHADDLTAADRRAFADGLMSRGLYALALKEYSALAGSAKAGDGLDVILYRLAECQRQTGDNRAAAATCERFEREFPQSPSRFNASITHALALSATGDSARASRIFDIIAADPSAEISLRLYAMYFAGECYFNDGKTDAARSRLDLFVSMASSQQNLPQGQRELKDFALLYLADIDSKSGDAAAAARALDSYASVANAASTPRVAAEALYRGATAAYLAGKFDDSVARFSRLMEKHPSDRRAKDALPAAAWANFNAGRHADAAAIADRIVAGDASGGDAMSEALYVKAASLARLSRNAEAAETFATLLAKFPGARFAKNARYERIVLLFKDGRHRDVLSEAAAFADPPAEIAPDLLWLQAEASEALGDTGRAIQFYAMLASRHAASPLAEEAQYRSARHLRESKSWAEAAKAYHAFLLAHAGSKLAPYACYESASCLMQIGRLEDAVRDYDALLDGHPGHKLEPDALLQKAMALRGLGRGRDAGAALDTLIARHPKSDAAAQARFQRARILYEGGDYAGAEGHLRELLKANPPDEARLEASFLLGLSLAAQKRDGDAAQVLQPLVGAAIRDKIPIERLVWLADFQFSRGKYAETGVIASEILRREGVTEAMRQSANVMLARSRAALGDADGAAAAFKAAADSPSKTRYSAEAALRYGELAMGMADKYPRAEAERYLRAAVERASSDEESSTRALAYRRLAECREAAGDADGAIRLNLAVSLLYDGGDDVRAAMLSAERLLRAAGREGEANAVRDDFNARFGEGGAR